MPPTASGSLWSTALVLLVCATAAVAAQAPPSNQAAINKAAELFRANNIKLWPEVLRIAGVAKEIEAAPARYAALIPSDVALESFLKQMGLTMAGLAARPQLAKQLVTHHLVLAFPPDAQQALLEGRLTAVPTLAGGDREFNVLKVALKNAAGQQQQQQVLHVTDTQGQTAVVVKVVQIDANKVAVIIDKVLLSGHYYTTFASLCKHRAAPAGPMCDALSRAGVLTNPSSSDFANTVFMPGPQAFQQARIRLAGSSSSSSSSSGGGSVLSQAQLVELVRYHVVPGLHTFPDGFQSGQSYATLLPGASLGIEYSGSPAKIIRTDNDTLTAYVIPADKQRVPVVVVNVFVGQGVAHGIPAVLIPPGFKLPATAAPAAAGQQQATRTAEEQGRPAAGRSGSGRRLLGSGIDSFSKTSVPFNTAETEIRSLTRNMFREAESRWS